MNKEALRKEFEDCWDACSDHMNWVRSNPRYKSEEPPTMTDYITTRLAALDDGTAEVKSTGGFKKRIVDLFKTMPNESECDTADILYRLQFILDEYKESILPKPVDDGQEGKATMKELVKKIFGDEAAEDKDIVDFYERVHQTAIEETALPVADGEGEKVGAMIEYLDGLPISSGEGFNMLKAIKQKLHETTLPSAVTGGGFIWTDEIVEEFAKQYRFSSSRISIEMFKAGKCFPYPSEGQPEQGGKPFMEGKDEK